MKKERVKAEYGDFQTPPFLASQVCQLLAARQLRPQTIIEPTCGLGHLFFAALDVFSDAQHALAVDLNRAYVSAVAGEVAKRHHGEAIETIEADFFNFDWAAKLRELPEPLLVIGNPPWVTNSELSALDSDNLPHKSNFQGRSGLDALTGKSNFDISEWMLLRMFEWLLGKRATLAVLCKTAVARKVLAEMWRRGAPWEGRKST